ncbi:MAG: hypothetical protein M3285_09570 [Actinomycetota bacterium]|nr:hypothetical protein [Actinomycetota bacterium]
MGSRDADRGAAVVAVLVSLVAMLLTQVTSAAWGAGGGGGPATQVNAEPETDTSPVGTQHTIGVSARDANDQSTATTPIRGDILPGSPNATPQTAQAELSCPTDSTAVPGITFPAGQTQTHECTYTGNSAGTDTIRFFADSNNNQIFDQGEPFDDVTETWSGTPFALQLTPDSDTAASTTCNEFTARVIDQQGNPVVNQQVDIQQVLQNAGTEPGETRELAFCNPSNPQGPNPTGQGVTAFSDVQGNNQGQTAGQAGRNTTVHAEVGPTNNNGEVTFGIAINHVTENATVSVRAWAEVDNDDQFEAGEPTDQPSTKTWTPGGSAAVTGLNARPEAATNPNGTEHEVRVKLIGETGPIAGVTPNSVIATNAAGRPQGDVADPNAGTSPNAALSQGNFNVYSCTPSNANGVSVCIFQDTLETAAGIDTIVFYVNQASGGTAGPDFGEPQDAVQKTWVNRTVHGRLITLSFDHAGRGENRVLVASGRLTVSDEFGACVSNQQILVQRRIDSQWVTKQSTVTTGRGRYAVEMSDQPARYRALAPRVEFTEVGDDWVHVCAQAAKARRHRHR